MRTLIVSLVALALLAIPTVHAEESVVGSGHIMAGSPSTSLIGIPDVTSLFFASPAAGTLVFTETADNSGLGYDIDLYFYDSAGGYISGCATEAVDETCVVPAGAAEVEVSAFSGVDLDVTLYATL